MLLVGQRVPAISFPDQFSIVLGGFSEEEAAQALESRLGPIEPDLVKRLHQTLGGNPVALARAAFALHQRWVTWDELLKGIRDFHYTGLVGPHGRSLKTGSPEAKQIIVDVSKVNDHILHELHEDPNKWRALTPAKFEEMVAELLAKLDYDVVLTPLSADGGFDMYAAKKDGLGEFLFLVECKRYIPPTKVGVEIVRALQGVLSQHRANGAAIFTTSFFTSGAKEFQRQFEHQLKLHDYLALQRILS